MEEQGVLNLKIKLNFPVPTVNSYFKIVSLPTSCTRMPFIQVKS